MRSTRHSKYNINYHLVWIPKYQRPVLTGDVADHLKDIFHTIAEKKGVEILSLEIMPDHIHLFISSPPQNAPSLLINW
ncbi:MAG: IS200/IS605 family transposase, partial [Methanothrix soehngenii]|nr:IS200/IS605 family transposase [Methanothrix soehngenii]